MPTAAAAVTLLLLLFSTSTSTPHPRRILHQPLLPEDSPPSPPPAPSPPKYPFSTSAPDNSPFFQSYPSPPPPPPAPASFASFPANISSITVPGPTKPSATSSKLIIAAVAAVIAAITVVSLAVFLHLRHRTASRRSSSFNQSKPPNSDTSSAISFNQAPNPRHIPKLHRPSQSSSEFLYLGTLVNSHVPAAGATTTNYSHAAVVRKFDSPELRPLPPLNMQRQNLGSNAEVISSKDDESEEFYSPKGSINGRDSSIGAGSASRSAFAAVVVENFNGSTSNSSSTYSSSVPGSGSPARSASFSLSPANNHCPINPMPKSPDLIEIRTVAPPLPPQMASLPEARDSVLQESVSPSPSSSSSLERHSRKSEEISPRNSSILDRNSESPARINSPVHPDTTAYPEPPERRDVELAACASPLPTTSSSPESSPRNSNVLDRNVESPARSSSAIHVELHHIPTSPELLEFATPLAMSSWPRNSNASDQSLESPGSGNSFLQHTIATPLEIQGLLAIPESASPLPPERRSTKSSESSPRNSNVTDHFAESPVRSSSPVHNDSAVTPPQLEMKGLVVPGSAPPLLPNSNLWDWNVESPVRSHSSAQQKAAEIPTASESALPVPPISFSPDRCLRRSEESSPRNLDNIESPTVREIEALVLPESSSQLAQGSYLSREESLPQNSKISDQNVESPLGIIIPANHNSGEIPADMEAPMLPFTVSWSYLSSEESSPRSSNASVQNSDESSAHSPSFNNYSNASDQYSDQNGNGASPVPLALHSATTTPSPETNRSENEESVRRTLNDSDQNMEPPSGNSSSSQHSAVVIPPPYIPVFLPSLPPPAPPLSVIPPPLASVPPPPPPPPPPQRPSPKTPTASKHPLEPPPLLNPLRPIGFESCTLISPMQLPSENDEDKESPSKETSCSRDDDSNPKPRLKPLHWDKVRASSDREMVWDQLKCSSFKLNEEMIETLFVVNPPKPSPNEATRWQVLPPPSFDNGDRVLDPKKSQNIAILLKALHVTVDEVCEGLLEGNAEILGNELLESLLKMAPTKEEERKLREYEDGSSIKLGPAERFLKAVIDIPHAFKRVEALLYASNFESEVDYLKKSFSTLEAACEELRTSKMFLKLLEAVLKTGNRMNVGTNRGDAHAFKLDTLLKLADVKGADGKTTLLHFVVQEIIRSEGARFSSENHAVEEANNDAKCRKLGLQVVSSLTSELSNVKKAAVMDAEVLSTYVSKLAKGITNVNEILELNMEENSRSSKFRESITSFLNNAEEEIFKIQAQERLALSLVKEITEYFHGNSAMEEPHPFRIFTVVRDFLTVLDRVCKEVGMINERTIVSSAHKFPVPVNPMLQQATGPVHSRLQTCSDDDDESLPFNV